MITNSHSKMYLQTSMIMQQTSSVELSFLPIPPLTVISQHRITPLLIWAFSLPQCTENVHLPILLLPLVAHLSVCKFVAVTLSIFGHLSHVEYAFITLVPPHPQSTPLWLSSSLVHLTRFYLTHFTKPTELCCPFILQTELKGLMCSHREQCFQLRIVTKYFRHSPVCFPKKLKPQGNQFSICTSLMYSLPNQLNPRAAHPQTLNFVSTKP